MCYENNDLAGIVKEGMQRDSRGRRDLCAIYADREKFDRLVCCLADMYRGKVDYVASPESLGYILGSSVAAELGVGFIPMRNGEHSYLYEDDEIKASYIDHRDTVRTLKVRKGSIPAGSRILLADDWVETAATIQACRIIVEEAEAKIIGIVSIGETKGSAAEELKEKGLLHSIYEE